MAPTWVGPVRVKMLGMPGYAKDVLVEPDWLERRLDDDSLRVLEIDEDPAAYAVGHIPGAIGLDWRRDLQDPVRRRFLGPDELGRLLGERGVSNDHLVVVYGDRNNWFAAFGYWYLRYYGHDNVRLLNGPRERWIADGRPTETALPAHAPTSFTARGRNEAIRAQRDEVLLALEGELVLVDVRSPGEYAGRPAAAGTGGEGAQRLGHIPGARSVPWAQAVNEDGTFKPADELRDLYRRNQVLGGEPIITYCSIGERSAHTWFVLHELLGASNVKNYEGSWTEWGNLVDVPIEKGS